MLLVECTTCWVRCFHVTPSAPLYPFVHRSFKAQTGLRTFAVVALSRVLWDLLQRWRGPAVERCPKKLQVELQASAEELNMAKSELETWRTKKGVWDPLDSSMM